MDLIVTNLTLADISQAVRNELKSYFSEISLKESSKEDEIGGIALAMKITGLAKPTIYSRVSTRTIPHRKKGKRLYFSRNELTEWIDSGRRKTRAEIAIDADTYSGNDLSNCKWMPPEVAG